MAQGHMNGEPNETQTHSFSSRGVHVINSTVTPVSDFILSKHWHSTVTSFIVIFFFGSIFNSSLEWTPTSWRNGSPLKKYGI